MAAGAAPPATATGGDGEAAEDAGESAEEAEEDAEQDPMMTKQLTQRFQVEGDLFSRFVLENPGDVMPPPGLLGCEGQIDPPLHRRQLKAELELKQGGPVW